MVTSMKTKKKTNHTRRTASLSAQFATQELSFLEHLYELRRRLYFVAASVLFWGISAYLVQQHIVNVLLRPAHGQSFIYTSPGGGIDFLFRICIYTGIICSLPLIVYHLLRFIEPVIGHASHRFVLVGSSVSGILAAAGVVFGYYLGLPAALHFLFHQFTTAQIRPLVTIQSYLGFVIVYMVGSALLFQLPLLLLFINRIKPLKPQKLLHYERWVILVAFLLAGLMNPTPNLFSQLLVAGPFIVMYQIGIVLIALVNRQAKRAAPVVWSGRPAHYLAPDPKPLQNLLPPQPARMAPATATPPAPIAVAMTPKSPSPTKPFNDISPVRPPSHPRLSSVDRPVMRRPVQPRRSFMEFDFITGPSALSPKA